MSSQGIQASQMAMPWRSWIEQRSLVIVFPAKWPVLSWAPLGGGAVRARVIVNHQIEMSDRAATESPGSYLASLVTRLGFKPESAVAMMTGAPVRDVGRVNLSHDELVVSAWCTAGCSNSLRIGDPATFSEISPGTINIALAVNQRLSPAAMAEALAMVTEARVAAVLQARVASVVTGRPATGTGTDCIAVASPPARGRTHSYCGKHTVLGELIGRAAMQACSDALERWTENSHEPGVVSTD